MATLSVPNPNSSAFNTETVIDTSALNQVRPPLSARRAARVLLSLLLVTSIALIFVPWQQFLDARGRVIAFDPTLREQLVEAPVTGRIIKVHVVEGEEVEGRKLDENGNVIKGKEGTLMVSIRDPDPDLMNRLQLQKQAMEQKLAAAEKQVTSLNQQIDFLKLSRDQAILLAEKEIEITQKQENAANNLLESAAASYKFSEYQHEQQKKLLKDGLTSELDYQKATRELLASRADKNRSEFKLIEAKLEVLQAKGHLDKVGFDFNASIRSTTASKEKAEAEVANNKAALTVLEVRIARQGTQDVYAPCNGTVYRVLATGAGGGMIVQAGTPLLRVVPEIPEDQRVVELIVSGNDAPLILELWQTRLDELSRAGLDEKPEIKVRLQFEGYPAIQWVGWPSAAVGTFGGVIDFVDPTDNGSGNFRILVSRDPKEEETNPWPSGYALRQGLRVNGWVLLNQVPMGWELWRRLNGFPPVVAEEHPEKSAKKPAVIKGLKKK